MESKPVNFLLLAREITKYYSLEIVKIKVVESFYFYCEQWHHFDILASADGCKVLHNSNDFVHYYYIHFYKEKADYGISLEIVSGKEIPWTIISNLIIYATMLLLSIKS